MWFVTYSVRLSDIGLRRILVSALAMFEGFGLGLGNYGLGLGIQVLSCLGLEDWSWL